MTDTYSYDAWGNLLSSSGSTTNPYRFVGGQGYYKDSESEFHLLTHRYHASAAARIRGAPRRVDTCSPRAV